MSRGRIRYWLLLRWRGELRFALWFAARHPFGGGLAYLLDRIEGKRPVTPYIYPSRGKRRQ